MAAKNLLLPCPGIIPRQGLDYNSITTGSAASR